MSAKVWPASGKNFHWYPVERSTSLSTPWALFCTLSGWLADRYSKRQSLIFWKVAEVGICGLALFGFWLGTDGGHAHLGAWVVLSTVFLMGTHSAFFVPAKYGIMPEIESLLSAHSGELTVT